MKFLNKVWNYLVEFTDEFARARAATELARRGLYKQANCLMTQKSDKK
jgi:hypothetical protein